MSARVLLISPPWRLASWPSLALGSLKAHLRVQGIEVDALHLHLDVALRFGWDRYEDIAAGWELPEALYFALHAPLEADAILARSADAIRRGSRPHHADLASTDTVAELGAATIDALDRVDLEHVDLLGFSVGALQLGATAYLSRLCKQRRPDLRIVLGGSALVGTAGERLLTAFPWVDFVVDGEGEFALAALASAADLRPATLGAMPNIWFRGPDGLPTRSPSQSIGNLDILPTPDFREYFDAAREAALTSRDVVLPVEASRGCQWEHRKGDGKLRGCTFCGMYRTSPDFRVRGLDAVLARVREGVRQGRTGQLGFVDAYLPSTYVKPLLRALADDDIDTTLFCEMRCDLDAETARLLADAGARHVQLGVEAFDTPLLTLMGKGMRMIDNVASIKLCQEFTVPYQYNLISRFPGATAESLTDMLALLPSLFAYQPPSLSPLYLDRGSRMFVNPLGYGIAMDSLDRSVLPFLPSDLSTSGICQVVPFTADVGADIDRGWIAIERAVMQWSELHSRARARGVTELLTWCDFETALEISDFRGGEEETIVVEGIVREVMLACDRVIHRRDLALATGLNEQDLEPILARLCELRIVVREGEWVLSLPLRAKLPNGTRRRLSRDAEACRRVLRLPLHLSTL